MEETNSPRFKALVEAANKAAKQVVAKAKQLKKTPVKMEIAQGEKIITVMSDELSLRELIKHYAVIKVAEIKKKQVEENIKASQQIIEIINATQKELADLVGEEPEKDGRFNWMSAEKLFSAIGKAGDYSVPNENFYLAQKKFSDMMKAHGRENTDPFVVLAKAAFSITREGRVKEAEILRLRNAGFKKEEYAEWEEINALLATCLDRHTRKMAVSISERESLKHNWKVITERG